MKKKDPMEALRIYNWIGKNLVDCEDPRRTGKALTGEYRGSWRCRIGNYRILAEIHDGMPVILLIDIGHRRGGALSEKIRLREQMIEDGGAEHPADCFKGGIFLS